MQKSNLNFLLIISTTFFPNFILSNTNVHAFFYLWYGIPKIDGQYMHWDHEVLPHWESSINQRYPNIGQRHDPFSGNIHSPFYPERNPYSSKDPDVLRSQFYEMKRAGISVAVLSWWGQKSKSYSTDTQGVSTDAIMHNILRFADQDPTGIKIALHLEPYPSRTVESVREDIEYIFKNYGNYSSLYRMGDGKPLFYIYDSYHIEPSQWQRLLRSDGDVSVRETDFDAHFIALWLESWHGQDIKEGGFNGAYTYFASDGFSYGSTTSNWNDICHFCYEQGLFCILSVGPGYNDTSIRPWNAHNTKDREEGKYYERMWKKASRAQPTIISITSFNEWGEGTQIEPAREVHASEGFSKEYLNYEPDGPYKYIDLTAVLSNLFIEASAAVENEASLSIKDDL